MLRNYCAATGLFTLAKALVSAVRAEEYVLSPGQVR
jgi:hypothetical protein